MKEGDADPKKAAIEAAKARAAKKKAQMAQEGVEPGNTENLTDTQQKAIDEVDSRRGEVAAEMRKDEEATDSSEQKAYNRMQFPSFTSPHTDRPNSVRKNMLWVIAALMPGAAAMFWYFGWGIIINMVIASATAVSCEALVMKMRGRQASSAVGDLSALLTALLLAVALPPLLPWWLTVIGTAFAIVVVKQLYGGLGYNPFNPAMAGYVLLLISYPVQMTSWLPPVMLNENPLTLIQTATVIFTGALPIDLTWDALTMASPLDSMRTQLDLNVTLSEIKQSPLWGDFGGRGWEWSVTGSCWAACS